MRLSGFKVPMNGSDLIAEENYNTNVKLEKKMRIGLIYDQKDKPVANMLYGDSNIHDSGCELVAIYNAIYLKNYKKISFSNLIRYSEKKAYSMRNGVWGTTPYRIGKILTYYGIKYSVCKKKADIKLKNGKIYIVSVYNEGGLLSGVHTFTILAKRKRFGYYVYNDGKDQGKEYRNPKNRKGIFKKREFIIGYCLKG